jgi:hypothetical protein
VIGQMEALMSGSARPLASQRQRTIVRAMPQRPKHLKIASVDVTPAERSAPVRTGPGTAAPSRFTADVQLEAPDLHVSITIRVSAGGLPVVDTLTVRPTPRTPLTSGTVRQILLDPIVRAALAAAVKPVTGRPDIAPGAFQVAGDSEYEAWVTAPAGATERVQQIARLYNEALTAGSRSPGLEAANAVHLSRAQAARYIKKAREAGLIPPIGEVTRTAQPAATGAAAAKPDPGLSIFISPDDRLPGYPGTAGEGDRDGDH